jgi:alkanesulfonate monooxygenase SsuD/methylene tetrahydromethanopterin reductase-like flavin-dependent oxidoreductase (luciferase family)
VESVDAFARDPEAAIGTVRERALVGSLDDVAEAVRSLEARGVTDLILRPQVAGTSRAEVMEAIRALGQLAAQQPVR